MGDLLPSFFPFQGGGFLTIEREKMEKKKEPPSRMTPGERLDRQRDKRAQILAALAATVILDIQQIAALLNVARSTAIETIMRMMITGIIEVNTIPYTKKKIYSLTALGILHAGNKGYRFDERRSMAQVHHLLGLAWAYLFVNFHDLRWLSDREIKEKNAKKAKEDRWACLPDGLGITPKNAITIFELELHPHPETNARRGCFYHGCLSSYTKLFRDTTVSNVIFIAENDRIAANIGAAIGQVIVTESGDKIALNKSQFFQRFHFVSLSDFIDSTLKIGRNSRHGGG